MSSCKNCPAALAGGQDRLSELPDDVLGNIVSFLPSKEAGRAALLSTRWRVIFGCVHTISFEEEEGARAGDWETDFFEAEERQSCSLRLLDDVSSALLCRRRCSVVNAPLRSFHFAFDDCHWWDEVMVNQWLTYVLQHSQQELHLDLCFQLGEICDTEYNDKRSWQYLLPRRLFSCVALRTLRLRHCQLNLPDAINLPHAEELRLTSIHEPWETIQRLISSCPRLVDLTLEACSEVTQVTVLDKRLRRFSLRCCHEVASVAIDATDMRAFDYRGRVPAESLLTLQGSPRITSCSVDFCGKDLTRKAEFARLRKLPEQFVDAKHLHLQSVSLGSSLESRLFVGFPSFLSLRRLVLQGCHERCSILYAVRRILQQTPNLEVLSLHMEPQPPQFELDSSPREQMYGADRPKKGKSGKPKFVAPDESSFGIPCLQRRVREINMVHYRGNEAQRVLARMLFRNALVLERLCVVFPEGPLALQAELVNEISTWAVDKSEKVFL